MTRKKLDKPRSSWCTDEQRRYLEDCYLDNPFPELERAVRNMPAQDTAPVGRHRVSMYFSQLRLKASKERAEYTLAQARYLESVYQRSTSWSAKVREASRGLPPGGRGVDRGAVVNWFVNRHAGTIGAPPAANTTGHVTITSATQRRETRQGPPTVTRTPRALDNASTPVQVAEGAGTRSVGIADLARVPITSNSGLAQKATNLTNAPVFSAAQKDYLEAHYLQTPLPDLGLVWKDLPTGGTGINRRAVSAWFQRRRIETQTIHTLQSGVREPRHALPVAAQTAAVREPDRSHPSTTNDKKTRLREQERSESFVHDDNIFRNQGSKCSSSLPANDNSKGPQQPHYPVNGADLLAERLLGEFFAGVARPVATSNALVEETPGSTRLAQLHIRSPITSKLPKRTRDAEKEHDLSKRQKHTHAPTASDPIPDLDSVPSSPATASGTHTSPKRKKRAQAPTASNSVATTPTAASATLNPPKRKKRRHIYSTQEEIFLLTFVRDNPSDDQRVRTAALNAKFGINVYPSNCTQKLDKLLGPNRSFEAINAKIAELRASCDS